MRKQVLFLGFISVSIFLVSCSRNTINVTAPTVREEVKDIPKFVTMNEVTNLSIGMSYTEVKNIMGTPYNILSAQMDGYALYQYKYRQIYVELPTTKRNDVGIEKGANKLKYTSDIYDLNLLFSKENRLEFIYSNSNQIAEGLMREANLYYVLKKDKEKFANDFSPEYRQANKIFEPGCDKCPTQKAKAIGGYSLDSMQQKQRMNKVFDGILLVPGTPKEN
jgi:outer membrane protein assembly factor BamE (lipoprotein component of BamABCDE complex)